MSNGYAGVRPGARVGVLVGVSVTVGVLVGELEGSGVNVGSGEGVGSTVGVIVGSGVDVGTIEGVAVRVVGTGVGASIVTIVQMDRNIAKTRMAIVTSAKPARNIGRWIIDSCSGFCADEFCG